MGGALARGGALALAPILAKLREGVLDPAREPGQQTAQPYVAEYGPHAVEGAQHVLRTLQRPLRYHVVRLR